MGVDLTEDPIVSGRVHGSPREAVLEAEQALELVQVRPEQARALAESALRRERKDHDREAVAVAERALGLAASELDDIPGAAAHLRRSIDAGAAAGLPPPRRGRA